jgi:uncharacterized Tic20 family protein
MPGETPGAGQGVSAPPPSAPASGGGYPPTSGGGYPPPTSGPGYTPTSGAGSYPPPGSGAGYTPAPGYPPTSGAGGYPTPEQQQYPSQGYATPGGYDANPGYPGPAAGGNMAYPGQQPAYGVPPQGYANNDEKTYVMIAHWGGVAGVFLGGGVLGWVGPLIAYVSKGAVSPTVRAHAITSLNFHITWATAVVLSWVLAGVTCGLLFFIPLLVWLVPLIVGIVGGVKATNGEFYRYPMSYPFIKQ